MCKFDKKEINKWERDEKREAEIDIIQNIYKYRSIDI